jgi:hypothetical protein
MHSKFPASFKEEVEELVEALSQATWFIGMPGPARLTVMDRTVTDMAREAVWGMLDPGFWEVLGGEGEVEHELLGPGVESSTIETLIKHWGKQPAKGQDRRLQVGDPSSTLIHLFHVMNALMRFVICISVEWCYTVMILGWVICAQPQRHEFCPECCAGPAVSVPCGSWQ